MEQVHMMQRRSFLALTAASIAAPALPAFAATDARGVLQNWYKLVLELVRHTATYTPPVASRAFAYLGITAYEVLASGQAGYQSLAGQINGFAPLPPRPDGVDDAAALNAALAKAIADFFGNTGPTGQRAMDAMQRQMDSAVAASVDADTAARSAAYGLSVAAHILQYSQDDGGAVITNMGFPDGYTPAADAWAWVPTSKVSLQQAPLLPNWGNNRTFAMANGKSCPVAPHTPYSEDPASQFYADAMEVYKTSKSLTEEQERIARFWSDDPMLSPTPPGHWISIALQIIDRDGIDGARSADLLARLGIALADSFIGNWADKYLYNLLRPVTYIRRHIDPAWQPLLITPPFPDHPSGHSTQSGAAATVLTAFFGEGFAFSDNTHEADGIPTRSYPDFWTAAREAADSRLYGGIHFRPANDLGIEQGRCIGGHAAALRTNT
jgi:hypothetical protein